MPSGLGMLRWVTAGVVCALQYSDYSSTHKALWPSCCLSKAIKGQLKALSTDYQPPNWQAV
jgi:hypothetical protein